MSLDDLEKKLLTAPAPKPAPAPSSPVDAKKAEAEAKKEAAARAKVEKDAQRKAAAEEKKAQAEAKKKSATVKPEPVKPEPVKPEPVAEVAPAPVKGRKPATKSVTKAGDYDLSAPVSSKPKAEKPKAEMPKISLPKVELPQPKPSAPAKVVVKDDNAILGVGLGIAPLVAVPVVGLSAVRSALAKTQARRAQIQKEIEAQEAAKAKKQFSASTDGGEVAKAFVSLFKPIYF